MSESWLYKRIAHDLAPLTPTQYIRECRADGIAWPDIARLLKLEAPHGSMGAQLHTPTLRRWADGTD